MTNIAAFVKDQIMVQSQQQFSRRNAPEFLNPSKFSQSTKSIPNWQINTLPIFVTCLVDNGCVYDGVGELFWWMDDMQFYVPLNSISVISGRWKVDNESLCAMELYLWLKRFCLERGLKLVR